VFKQLIRNIGKIYLLSLGALYVAVKDKAFVGENYFFDRR